MAWSWDASSWSASVLMINPNAEEIVLPCQTCVGKFVPISAVSVALADPELSGDVCGPSGPFGGYCGGISSFAGGGKSAITA